MVKSMVGVIGEAYQLYLLCFWFTQALNNLSEKVKKESGNNLDFYVPWLRNIFLKQYCVYTKRSRSLTLCSQERINKVIRTLHDPHTLEISKQ